MKRRYRTVASALIAGILLLWISPGVAAGQAGDREVLLKKLMKEGRESLESGQYLYAARTFNFIARQAVDSSLQAEALYHFKKTGDRAADAIGKLYNTRRLLRGALDNSAARAVWDSTFKPLIQQKITSLEEAGLKLKPVAYWYEYHIVNMDTVTGNYLMREYPDTRWAERIRFQRISREIDSRGYPKYNHPRPVIRKSRAFINRYPRSRYRYDVTFILGKAYSDMWHLLENYSDLLTEEERENADSLRRKAVKYLAAAYDNRERFIRDYSYGPELRVIKKLKAGEYPDIFYFFAD